MTRVSVITVCFNSATTLRDTLISVAAQTHPDVEHIIIDGASTDDTLDVIRQHGAHVAKLVSEPDKGIYDAMNKGVQLATGDLVAFLNSDDIYADERVLRDVVEVYEQSPCDLVYGDLVMVNGAGVIVRDWRAGEWLTWEGMKQIPHPALFVSRKLLSKLEPPFDDSYRIAADLKQQMLMHARHGARSAYARRRIAVMRLGGTSTHSVLSYVQGWRETLRAHREVYGRSGLRFLIGKVLQKLGHARFFAGRAAR